MKKEEAMPEKMRPRQSAEEELENKFISRGIPGDDCIIELHKLTSRMKRAIDNNIDALYPDARKLAAALDDDFFDDFFLICSEEIITRTGIYRELAAAETWAYIQRMHGNTNTPVIIDFPFSEDWATHKTAGKTIHWRVTFWRRWYSGAIRDAITEAAENRATPEEAKEAVEIITGDDHGAGGLNYHLDTIVRTEADAADVDGTIEASKAAGVEFVRLVEILDDRTCTKCRAKNGRIIEVSRARRGITIPPFHPNCRGKIVPVINN